MYMLDKEVVVFMNLFQHVKYKYGYERSIKKAKGCLPIAKYNELKVK